MAFVGCVISVSIKNYSLTYASVGGTHCQGVVVHVDSGSQAITLSQPFVDGIPGKVSRALAPCSALNPFCDTRAYYRIVCHCQID